MSKVITLSKTFLKGHPREGKPTGFKEAFLAGQRMAIDPGYKPPEGVIPKIHTLRENKNGYYKDGETLSVREWEGRPYASKQVEIAEIVVGVEPVLLGVRAWAGGVEVGYKTIATNDGLTLLDFCDWFDIREGFTWEGSIIHFTDFRYGS